MSKNWAKNLQSKVKVIIVSTKCKKLLRINIQPLRCSCVYCAFILKYNERTPSLFSNWQRCFFYRVINEVLWIRLIAFVYPEAHSCFVDSREQKTTFLPTQQDYSELCQRLLLRWRPFNMSIQWMEINKKTYCKATVLICYCSLSQTQQNIRNSCWDLDSFLTTCCALSQTDCHLLSAALTLFSTPDICTTCVWEALMIPELQIKCSF